MKNQKGHVLITAIMVLGMMLLLGLLMGKRVQLSIFQAGMYKHKKQAFYAAESGIHLAAAKVNNGCLEDPPCSQDEFEELQPSKESFKFDVIDTGDVWAEMPILEVDSFGKSGRRSARIKAQLRAENIPYIFQSPAALYLNGDLENKGVSGSILGEYRAPLCVADDIWTTEYISNGFEAEDYTADVGEYDDRKSLQPKYPFNSAFNILKAHKTANIEVAENNMFIGDSTNLTNIYFHDGDWVSSNLDGYGILVIGGDMVTSGNVTWHGQIYVMGDIIYNGGGHKEVYGSVIANGNVLLNGTVDIHYDYCTLGDDLVDSMKKYKLSWWKRIK